MNNELVIKFFDIKKEYIDEVRNIINIISIENVDKINNQIKEYYEKLMDKSKLLNNSLVNDITNKFDRFDDKINLILQKNNIESLEKMNSLVNLSNGSIVDKINVLLNSIIPNNNDKINKQIHDEINKFYVMIADETKK